MYKLIYTVESNKKTRKIDVYALKMSNTIMESVIKDFSAKFPDEYIIRAYLNKMNVILTKGITDKEIEYIANDIIELRKFLERG